MGREILFPRDIQAVFFLFLRDCQKNLIFFKTFLKGPRKMVEKKILSRQNSLNQLCSVAKTLKRPTNGPENFSAFFAWKFGHFGQSFQIVCFLPKISKLRSQALGKNA